jgi:hypothetical protein
MWISCSPLADNWKIPPGTGHKFLVLYMVSEQTKKYGRNIYDQFPHATLIRNMKLLCKEYPEDDIKRGIALAVLTSEHPFSTKYIKEKITWLQGIRSSPLAAYYRNKS